MANKRLRVTQVIHSLGRGGAERVLVDLATASRRHGVDVTVVSLTSTQSDEYTAGLLAADVPTVTLALPSRWDPRGLAKAARTVAATEPHVVHTHMKHADLLGAFAAHRLDVPLVSTLHLIEDAPSALGRVKRRLAAQARLRRAARTVAVSDAVRAWYVQAFAPDPSSVVTIPNGRARPAVITEVQRNALRAAVGIPTEATMVIVVGIMRPGKGHAAVLSAARHIRDAVSSQGLPLHFVFAGDGPLRPTLEQHARAEGVADMVTFAGYREDIPALLQASDLLVHASDFDALPTALIEALAAGLPAVAYRVGGVPEILTPDSGRLIEPGDVAGLGAAVLELAALPDLRKMLSQAATRRFEAEFAVDIFAGRLRDLYDTVLAERATVA